MKILSTKHPMSNLQLRKLKNFYLNFPFFFSPSPTKITLQFSNIRHGILRQIVLVDEMIKNIKYNRPEEYGSQNNKNEDTNTTKKIVQVENFFSLPCKAKNTNSDAQDLNLKYCFNCLLTKQNQLLQLNKKYYFPRLLFFTMLHITNIPNW